MKLKRGDKIKIIQRGNYDWVFGMDKYIGKILTITKIEKHPWSPDKIKFHVAENSYTWYTDAIEYSNIFNKKIFGIVTFCQKYYK